MIVPGPVHAQSDDLFSRIGERGGPDEAVSTLLSLMTERRGKGAFLQALLARIGDDPARMRQAQRVRDLVRTDGRFLADTVATNLALTPAGEAARQVTDILYRNVEGGISPERIRPVLHALVEVLLISSPAPPAHPASKGAVPVLRSGQDGDRSDTQPVPPGPAPDPVPVSVARPAVPPAVPTPIAAPVSGPTSGQPSAPQTVAVTVRREPDLTVPLSGPVRSADGTRIFAPLFAGLRSARAPGPVRLPASLPPPPATGDPEMIRSWLRGEPVWSDMIGVCGLLLQSGDQGDLMELESEFHTDPAAALRLYKARDPIADGAVDATWCARLGYGVGGFWVTHEAGVMALSAALARHLTRTEPDRAAPLISAGANITVREELAEAVCGLLDVERDYVQDGPSDTGGREQNLIGSFSPNASLVGGQCLERALILHLVSSVPFGSAMRQSLTEFRLAQALRANPNAPFPVLTDRYERDPIFPLEELAGLVPIVRIGYTEPALI